MLLRPIPLGQPTEKELPDTFSISTWNVWFDRHHREERFLAILQTLQQRLPEIMAFQEVTTPFIRALQAVEWLKNGYWLSAVEPNQLGVLLVSRCRPHCLEMVDLPSSMGRRLLVAHFADGLRVGVCHLESVQSNGPVRQEQLQAAQSKLRNQGRSLLLGDFNFPDGAPEAQAIAEDFVDLWPSHHPGDPGFTIDTTLNSMGHRGPSVVRLRLDRILCRGGLKVHSMERLGTEPFGEHLFCSDHFGLLAHLSM